MTALDAISTSTRGFQLLVTIHPSMILRVPDEADKRKTYAELIRDLKKVV